jgi:poly-gamma-glutamate capsule biosynthesis protein CapA/YwtB (metallophosphatase superfamily)
MKWKILLFLFLIIFIYNFVLGYIIFTNYKNFKTYIPSPKKVIFSYINKTISKAQFNPQPLSLNNIFSDNHTWIATLSADRVRTIISTGDIIPARSVNNNVVMRNNPNWPYEKVKQNTASMKPDILFINLESPLINNCPTTTEGMIFCGNVTNIEGLKYFGVNVANVANNHFDNHGYSAIQDTLSLLTNNGILTVGSTNPGFANIKGKTIAFLGYNNIGAPEKGIAWAKEETIKQDIAAAKQKADIVIVQFHWGTEYMAQPDNNQKKLGRFAIDSGADLVIGNHPHWIQPIEFYKGKLITYAHGNFVFDQMWSQKTREGVVGKYTFYDNQLIDVQYFPIQIDDYGQPHFVEDIQKSQILTDMQNQSEILQSK